MDRLIGLHRQLGVGSTPAATDELRIARYLELLKNSDFTTDKIYNSLRSMYQKEGSIYFIHVLLADTKAFNRYSIYYKRNFLKKQLLREGIALEDAKIACLVNSS
jgi:hypothetical protein